MSTSTTYDNTTNLISTGVAVLFVVLLVITRQWLVVALGVAILIGGYAWSPRGFTVAGREILVHRLIGDVHVPLAGLREARPAAAEDFAGAIRLFGSGGLFGYYGVFSSGSLGRANWYLTNRTQAVVVITEAKTAMFSPDDRDGFLKAIRGATVHID